MSRAASPENAQGESNPWTRLALAVAIDPTRDTSLTHLHWLAEQHRHIAARVEDAWRRRQHFAFALEVAAYARREELCFGQPTNLYFVCEADGRAWKIGFAHDPSDRLSTLQQANFRELIVFARVPGTRNLERFIHHVLRRHRLRGEWFSDAPRVLALASIFASVQEQIMLAEYFDPEPCASTTRLRRFVIELANERAPAS
jgi:hypothetical protein